MPGGHDRPPNITGPHELGRPEREADDDPDDEGGTTYERLRLGDQGPLVIEDERGEGELSERVRGRWPNAPLRFRLRFLSPWHRRYREWAMRETAADLEFLQRLMDETLADISPHMASIVSPDKRLRASQVVRYLEGAQYIAFGSVTPTGEPRVSPLDSVFVRGRFTLSTDGSAARVANLRHNPACSLVHMVGDTVAIVVHGRVEWITRDHPDHDETHSIWTSAYESDPYSWGDGIILFRTEPAAMWAYAQRPNDFPE